jgi:glycosyltransferase involved in cell wall biosynthesis
MRTSIIIIIITLNEGKNLRFALESCSFAQNVYVVDSGSSDNTREIAERYGASFIHHPWEGYARQKNWALDNLPIQTGWVFILDADEVITEPLRDELTGIATGRIPTDNMGFYVNRFFVWNGKEIRRCGYYPSWNLRFFRRGKARYEERDVHEHMIVDGSVGYLKGEMRHEDKRGKDYIWQKHLRYADLEAREMLRYVRGDCKAGIKPSFWGNPLERRRTIKKRVWPYVPFRFLLRFFYMYFFKKGFLDGKAGLDMCMFMSRYEREISKRFRKLSTLKDCEWRFP